MDLSPDDVDIRGRTNCDHTPLEPVAKAGGAGSGLLLIRVAMRPPRCRNFPVHRSTPCALNSSSTLLSGGARGTRASAQRRASSLPALGRTRPTSRTAAGAPSLHGDNCGPGMRRRQGPLLLVVIIPPGFTHVFWFSRWRQLPAFTRRTGAKIGLLPERTGQG